MTLKRVAVAALAALAVGFAVPATAKTFRMAVAGDANTMDPHANNAGNTTLILRQIYELLIDRGQKLEKVPGLAVNIPLHHQMIPWAMAANVTAAHSTENQLDVKWVKVN